MVGRMSEREATFVVQCIWCGETIRDDKQEEAEGVCLKCFYQIMTNHLHAQRNTPSGEYVSDR
jgi:hypothetical protein